MADRILSLYKTLNLEDSEIVKFGLMISPICIVMAFYVLVSPNNSTLISFSAFVTSITFIIVAYIILCDILIKDVGPRSMQDIAEIIREGSEGFFVTQYGTIFKFASVTAVLLFFMYLFREIP